MFLIFTLPWIPHQSTGFTRRISEKSIMELKHTRFARAFSCLRSLASSCLPSTYMCSFIKHCKNWNLSVILYIIASRFALASGFTDTHLHVGRTAGERSLMQWYVESHWVSFLCRFIGAQECKYTAIKHCTKAILMASHTHIRFHRFYFVLVFYQQMHIHWGCRGRKQRDPTLWQIVHAQCSVHNL